MARGKFISQEVGINWLAAGSPGDRPTKNCRHTKVLPGYVDRSEQARKLGRTHRQTQCPHCGLWALWVLR